jgi:four helix bundle protein
VKSATAIGAILEEAKAASSKREFVRYVENALRAARETAYWLRICAALELTPRTETADLGGEAEQIANVLGAIVVRTKLRMRTGYAVFAFCILNFALHVS